MFFQCSWRNFRPRWRYSCLPPLNIFQFKQFGQLRFLTKHLTEQLSCFCPPQSHFAVVQTTCHAPETLGHPKSFWCREAKWVLIPCKIQFDGNPENAWNKLVYLVCICLWKVHWWFVDTLFFTIKRFYLILFLMLELLNLQSKEIDWVCWWVDYGKIPEERVFGVFLPHRLMAY